MTLFPEYTKWIPLGNYSYAGTDYIVFCRKRKDNGMMSFKTKKANPSHFNHSYIPIALINTKEAWDQIKNL